MLILIAGPYRSGTGDDPVKMAANLAALEAPSHALFAAGHVPMIGEWVALPVFNAAGGGEIGGVRVRRFVEHVAHGGFQTGEGEVAAFAALHLLALCDGVLRLPGASTGADNDVWIATQRGIPVWHDLRDVPGVAP